MKRIALKGEWRTNYAQGATCTEYKLGSEEEELIYQIIKRIGIEVAGIDLFPTPEGMYVLEVNACPGWKALESVHPKIDIAKKIVDYLIQKIRA
jgi:ribosomal protein S6--L-glutamate ligase